MFILRIHFFFQIEPHSRVCYACWLAASRNVQRAQMNDSNRAEPRAQHVDEPTTSQPSAIGQQQISLPNFRRTANVARTCFVHGCINSDTKYLTF